MVYQIIYCATNIAQHALLVNELQKLRYKAWLQDNEWSYR